MVDPVSGVKMSLADAVRGGLVDPKTGKFRHPHTGKTMSLHKARQIGLLPIPEDIEGEAAEDAEMLSLKEALEQGRIDPNTGMVTGLNGNKYNLADAMHRGILDDQTPQIVDPQSGAIVGLQQAMKMDLLMLVQGKGKTKSQKSSVTTKDG